MPVNATLPHPLCRELLRTRESFERAIASSTAACKLSSGASGDAVISSEESRILLAALNLARLACEAANAAIDIHQAKHGCREEALGFEVVQLFNVTTEHWETIEAAVHGHPPAGALAYQSSEKPEGAQWIVDQADLSKKRQAGVRLHYTETGLNILREEGLEM